MKSLALIIGLLAAVQALPAKGPTPLDVYMPVIEGAPVPVPPKISGGQPASLGQFPHHAAILRDGGAGFSGGSLIAVDWVLTAAHCVRGISFEVILGRIQWQGTGGVSVVTTEKIPYQEIWDNITKNYDIALLHLPSKVTLTDNIQPVALTTADDISNDFVGVTATVSGFGRTTDTGDRSPNLMWVEVPVITKELCAQTYPNIIASKICTGGAEGKGTCKGDSGSALVIKRDGGFTQIGVVSHGRENSCALGLPRVYSRVTTFRAWIRQKSGV